MHHYIIQFTYHVIGNSIDSGIYCTCFLRIDICIAYQHYLHNIIYELLLHIVVEETTSVVHKLYLLKKALCNLSFIYACFIEVYIMSTLYVEMILYIEYFENTSLST